MNSEDCKGLLDMAECLERENKTFKDVIQKISSHLTWFFESVKPDDDIREGAARMAETINSMMKKVPMEKIASIDAFIDTREYNFEWDDLSGDLATKLFHKVYYLIKDEDEQSFTLEDFKDTIRDYFEKFRDSTREEFRKFVKTEVYDLKWSS